jgi:hypothetical protein
VLYLSKGREVFFAVAVQYTVNPSMKDSGTKGLYWLGLQIRQNNGLAACGGDCLEVFTTDVRKWCAVQWNGLGADAGTGLPVRRSVWQGDSASSLA